VGAAARAATDSENEEDAMALQWVQSKASNMHDVAASTLGFTIGVSPIVLAGADGSVWRMPEWNHFIKDSSPSIRRVAMSPDGRHLWGVGTDGTMWHSPAPNSWTRLDSTPGGRRIEDAVVNYDDSLWVTTENGMIWSTSDSVHWTWMANFTPFKRIGVSPNNVWWAVSSVGEVYFARRDPNAPGGLFWQDTPGKGFEDVTVTGSGEAWLVGSNGTVWHARDGQSFAQQAGANCFSVCAQTDQMIYFVLNDGTMWILEDLPSGTGTGGTGTGTGGTGTGTGGTGTGTGGTGTVGPPSPATCAVQQGQPSFSTTTANVRVSGAGFLKAENVQILDQEGTIETTTTADGLGRYSVEFSVIKGHYVFHAKGQTSGRVSNTAGITL
jgi:hypothetical protein